MNKLIKLTETHYIIVDDSEIKEGDFVYCSREGFEPILQQKVNPEGVNKDDYMFKITHSTQPLGKLLYFTNAFDSELSLSVNGLQDTIIENWGCKKLSLSEVEELTNGYNVEELALDNSFQYGEQSSAARHAFIDGFNAHKELVKDKFFSVEQAKKIFIAGGKLARNINNPSFEEIIQSLLPKTEWDVTFDEQGKLKLL